MCGKRIDRHAIDRVGKAPPPTIAAPPGSDVEVVEIGTERATEWNRFLELCPNATFYHRYEWLVLMRDEFGHTPYALAGVERGTIRGVLPLVLVKTSIFGSILCSMPFLNYGGPASPEISMDKLLVEKAQEMARDLGVDYLEIRTPRQLDINIPAVTEKVSMTLALSSDSELLWNSFTSKHRTNIRRAYKNGLIVKKGRDELLGAFFDVLARSWRDLGTPVYRRSFFEKILQSFDESIDVFICERGGEAVAAALNGSFGRTVEGMWAGATPLGRESQYSYVLYWEMIRDACTNDFDRFHLGRSSADSGGEIFKRKWNAIPTQLYWHYDLVKAEKMPGLNVDNPKYAAAIRVWKNLPVSITRLIGPPLAKGIP